MSKLEVLLLVPAKKKKKKKKKTIASLLSFFELLLIKQGEEEKRAAERDLEKDCGRREAEDGFWHLGRGCHRCERQGGMEKTSQRPYSPRGDKELSQVSQKQHLNWKKLIHADVAFNILEKYTLTVSNATVYDDNVI